MNIPIFYASHGCKYHVSGCVRSSATDFAQNTRPKIVDALLTNI